LNTRYLGSRVLTDRIHQGDTVRHQLFASAPNINPNTTGLPGTSEAEKIVGALLTYGLIASVAGLAIAAITWALGTHSANPYLAGRGKSGVLVACVAALLIGGADILVNFFANAGSSLS
jgi:hypothetical protein